MIEGDLYGIELYYDEEQGWCMRYKPEQLPLDIRYPRATFFAFVVLPVLIMYLAFIVYALKTLPIK